MFGYIKPNIGELKVKDYELYKATYCGLCRTMGKCTGCASKMTLSYDFVFFALVRMALEKTKGEVKKRRCPIHPFKKRLMLEINPVLEYSAKTSVMLTRIKLKDNVNDTHGFSRFLARVASLISLLFKKPNESLLPLGEKLTGCVEELSRLEKEGCDSIDMVADTCGVMIGHVVSYGLEGENEKFAYEIGYHLGKWVYVTDAFDDIKKDAKSGSYNVLRIAFGDELSQGDKALIQNAMYLELSEMSRAIDRIDFSQHRDVEAIVKNIAREGLVAETERVLCIDKALS